MSSALHTTISRSSPDNLQRSRWSFELRGSDLCLVSFQKDTRQHSNQPFKAVKSHLIEPDQEIIAKAIQAIAKEITYVPAHHKALLDFLTEKETSIGR